VGAIVGGVVGGVLGGLAIVAIILGIMWKRKKDRAKQVDGRFDSGLGTGTKSLLKFGII